MTAEDVKALPIDRKIQIMEAVWEDFRDRFDRLGVSQQQKDRLVLLC
jgi:PIN domain nuclease of toxin-antitoxin system